MSFTPSPSIRRVVPGCGPDGAKIMLIGEAPGVEENRKGIPFVGPAGTVLEQCLHAANIIKSDCYLTNVVKVHPHNNIITPFYIERNGQRAGRFTPEGEEWVSKLWEEINEVRPNLLVPLGNVALHACTGSDRILKYRGYVMDSRRGFKILPTIHPSASLRGKYVYRYLIADDLRKAKIEAEFPEIIRPERFLTYRYGSVQEAVDYIQQMHSESWVSTDIEVLNYEISCIGLAPSPRIAVSIPLGEKTWGEDASVEVPIWRALYDLLSDESVGKVFQNGSFDVQFLATKCGLPTRGALRDTMIGHSIMYPDMLKSLAFLGSLYCGAQEYWKDMVKFDDIKEES